MNYPLTKEISYVDPLQLFARFSADDGAVLLDSSQLREGCGRYSFIGVDPFSKLNSKNGVIQLNEKTIHGDPFLVLQQQLALFSLKNHAGLPPFQGGVVGYFSYDLCHHLEKIMAVATDDMQFPDMALGFYDLVIGIDHELKRAWIFSSGYPLQEKNARQSQAEKRCQWLAEKLKEPLVESTLSTAILTEIQSNFTAESYQRAVQQVTDYILSGDIFEANISQRFKAFLPSDLTAFQLYQRLRLLNPAPFAAYLFFDDVVLASASPERFLKLQQGKVEARPIKGTRARGATLEQDESLAKELMQSEKDLAENVMIVDLLRNDLSRVCQDHSVNVPQLCGLESYATVHHLVSVVTGTLQVNYDAVDLLRAAFPGGSITGAPKVRAMEIIAEIEPTCRGPYCGSIGYIGFNGDMDSSIVIRTYAIKNNIVTFQAGGAVVADSDPMAEYEETLVKAKALQCALQNL